MMRSEWKRGQSAFVGLTFGTGTGTAAEDADVSKNVNESWAAGGVGSHAPAIMEVCGSSGLIWLCTPEKS